MLVDFADLKLRNVRSGIYYIFIIAFMFMIAIFLCTWNGNKIWLPRASLPSFNLDLECICTMLKTFWYILLIYIYIRVKVSHSPVPFSSFRKVGYAGRQARKKGEIDDIAVEEESHKQTRTISIYIYIYIHICVYIVRVQLSSKA